MFAPINSKPTITASRLQLHSVESGRSLSSINGKTTGNALGSVKQGNSLENNTSAKTKENNIQNDLGNLDNGFSIEGKTRTIHTSSSVRPSRTGTSIVKNVNQEKRSRPTSSSEALRTQALDKKKSTIPTTPSNNQIRLNKYSSSSKTNRQLNIDQSSLNKTQIVPKKNNFLEEGSSNIRRASSTSRRGSTLTEIQRMQSHETLKPNDISLKQELKENRAKATPSSTILKRKSSATDINVRKPLEKTKLHKTTNLYKTNLDETNKETKDIFSKKNIETNNISKYSESTQLSNNNINSRVTPENSFNLDLDSSLLDFDKEIDNINSIQDSEFDWLDNFNDKKQKSDLSITKADSFIEDQTPQKSKIDTSQVNNFDELDEFEISNSSLEKGASLNEETKLSIEDIESSQIIFKNDIIENEFKFEKNDEFNDDNLDIDEDSSNHEEQSNDEESFEVLYDPKNPTKITMQLIAKRSFSEEEHETLSKDEIAETVLQLERIDLENCNIFEIDNLECFNHLTHLYLQHNHIEKISDQFLFLPELLFLSLFDNKIGTIENIHHLEKLQFLDISQNRISYLKVDELPKSLQYMNISNNPCCKKKNDFDNCRIRLLQYLSSLVLIDNVVVTRDERKKLNANMNDKIFGEDGLSDQLQNSFPTYIYSDWNENDDINQFENKSETINTLDDNYSWLHSDTYLNATEKLENIQFQRQFIENSIENKENSISDSSNQIKQRVQSSSSKKKLKNIVEKNETNKINTKKISKNISSSNISRKSIPSKQIQSEDISTISDVTTSDENANLLLKEEALDSDDPIHDKIIEYKQRNNKIYESLQLQQEDLNNYRKQHLISLFEKTSEQLEQLKTRIQQSFRDDKESYINYRNRILEEIRKESGNQSNENK